VNQNATGRITPSKITAFASAGVVVETYDWLLFGLLSPIYKEIFFPDTDQVVGYMFVWGIFGVGMCMRPLGALFFGWYGTRHGRHAMLYLTTVLMTIPMLVTALVPTYATIGVWAPLIVLAMRMMQGFCVGGEYSGTVIYLCETAPARFRGLIANTANGAASLGGVFASGVLLALTAFLNPDSLEQWGWRLAYAVGALVAFTAMMMRRRLPESEAFVTARTEGALPARPLRSALRNEWRPIIIAMLLVGYAQITFYFVMTYLPTLFKSIGNQGPSAGQAVTLVMAILLAVSSPFTGLLGDKIGRKWTLAGSALLIGLLAYPSFLLLESTNLGLVYLGAFILMAGTTTYWGGFSPAIVELFGSRDRVAATDIGYNVGTAIFGGTMGIAVTALVGATGDTLGPSIYMAAASAIAIIVALIIPETSRKPIDDIAGFGSRKVEMTTRAATP